MGTKRRPGKFDCYNRALPDEPIFVLLGRDRHAPRLVRSWAEMREREGEDPAVIAEAKACANLMERYRRGHPVRSERRTIWQALRQLVSQ